MQLFRPLIVGLVAVLAALVAPLLTQPAGAASSVEAADPLGTVTTVTGPADHADDTVPLDLAVATSGGAPVSGATVVVERSVGGSWQPFGSAVTGADGHAALDAVLARKAADNLFRASYAGDATYAPSTGQGRVALVKRSSAIRLDGPDEVVDEKSVTLTVFWRTGNGTPIAGTVRLYRRVDGKWKRHDTKTSGNDGRTSFTLRPRTDSRWQVRGVGQDWFTGQTSKSHAVDNLPPGVPVKLPAGAPSPRVKLPKQPRATGDGPNAAISRIPDRVWNQMTGITWHRGCPVGRSGLRYLKINYWDYQGYRRRGEMVVAAGAVGQVSRALADMYRAKLPIRSMYRVDRFGYSSRVRGGNDHKSMAAGNTSGFNCRDVVNRPGRRSPHSYGRSIDINTWENPYRSATGLVPNSWWMSRSHPRVAWRSSRHAVVRTMASNGIRWTYGNGDTQHFDVASGGRVIMARGCTPSEPESCH